MSSGHPPGRPFSSALSSLATITVVNASRSCRSVQVGYGVTGSNRRTRRVESIMSTERWTGIAGKRVLITGATNGIGLAAARRLADMDAEVTIVGRSADRARQAAATIGRPVDVLLADLASQDSVRRLAQEALERYERLDVLVNNAGAIYRTRRLSPDGIEMTWAVNHLAPFLLTTLVLDRLKASASARVVTTSSAAHYGAEIPF